VSTFIWNTLNEINPGALAYPGLVLVGHINQATDQLQGQVPTYTHVVEGILVHYWDGISETNPTFKFGYTDGFNTKEDSALAIDYWRDINVDGAPVVNSLVDFTFIQDGARELRAVRVKLRKTVTFGFGGTIKAEIHADAAGTPTGGAIATSLTIDTEKITTGTKSYEFVFATPPTLTAGLRYHIQLVPSWTPVNGAIAKIQIAVAQSSQSDFLTFTGFLWSYDPALVIAIADVIYKGRRPGENPAWIAFEGLTNPYFGIGQFMKASDFYLADMAEWADENDKCYDANVTGGALPCPRWKVGLPIDTSMPAWDFVTKLADLSRTKILKIGRKLKPVVRKPRAMTQIFTPGNIARGSFELLSEQDLEYPTVWQVQFTNEEIDYQRDLETITDKDALANGKSRVSRTINAFGLTSAARARSLAKDQMNLNKLRDVVTFGAATDSLASRPGDTIGVASYLLDLYADGSRIVDATSTTVTLDRHMASTVFSVSVRTHVAGQDLIQERAVVSQTDIALPSGKQVTKLTIGTPWTETPVQYNVFGVTTKDASAKVVQKFTAEKISIGQGKMCEIVASRYDDTLAVYDTYPGDITEFTPDIQRQIDIPPAAQNVKLVEVATLDHDGSLRYGIEVHYQKSRSWDKAEIWIRDPQESGYRFAGESWESPKLISSEYLAGAKNYEVVVRTVSVVGARQSIDKAPRAQILLVGPWAPPPDVTNFRAVQTGSLVSLRWDAAAPPVFAADGRGGIMHPGAVAGYELREGPWWSVARPLTGLITGTSFLTPAGPDGSRTYWVAARSRAGVRSQNPTKIVLTIADTWGDAPIDITHQSAATGGNFPGTKTNLAFDPCNQYLRMTGVTATYQLARTTVTTRGLRAVFVDVEVIPRDIGGKCFEQQYKAHSSDARRRGAVGWVLRPVDPGRKAANANNYKCHSWWSRFRYAGGQVVDIESGTKAIVEIRTSTDGVNFTAWTELEQGQVLDFTDLDVRVSMTAQPAPGSGSKPYQSLGLRRVRLRCVSARLRQRGTVSTPGGGTSSVTFSPVFPSAPLVTLGGRNLNGGDTVTWAGKTASGMTLSCRDSSNALVARIIDWIAEL
jgi:hypothetical protein